MTECKYTFLWNHSTQWHISLHSHLRISQLQSEISNTPKVVAPAIFINLLYLIFKFIKNINEQTLIATANIELQSYTKQYGQIRPKYRRATMLINASSTNNRVIIPQVQQDKVPSNLYTLIYAATIYITQNHTT